MRFLYVALLLLVAPCTAHSEDIIFFWLGSTAPATTGIYASSGPAQSQTIPLAISTTDQNVSNWFVMKSTDFFNEPGKVQDWGIWDVSEPTATWVNVARFEAESGLLSASWGISAGVLTANGGDSARYTFYAPSTGSYLVNGLVHGPTGANNSFLLNIDAEPTSPTMIWDVYPITTGLTWRDAPWRGNGTEETPQFNPKIFNLAQGTHTIVLRGRETGTQIDKIGVFQNQFSWKTVGSSITFQVDLLAPGKP